MNKMLAYHSYITVDFKNDDTRNYTVAQALLGNVNGAIEYLAPLGVKYLILEFNNGFISKSHPEISDGDVSPELLKECCAKLRAAGIEPIPLYACMGHQGWNSRNGFLKAYPEFDETPHIPDEHFHNVTPYYTPQWCGNDMGVYGIVLPVIDEIVEAMQCKYFHMGMDEIFLFGHCDRCKGMTPAELFRQNVMMVYNHLKEKGVQLMIWGDRLLNATKLLGEEKGTKRNYDFETLGVSDCIDELPKDIIVCDWHYGVEEEYPSVTELLTHDYTVWPSCWYNTEAGETFWKDANRQAKALAREDQLPVMLVTGWALRPLDLIFTQPEENLTANEQQVKKTLLRIGEILKA